MINNTRRDRLSVLYVTVPSYFDLEISLLRELNAITDLTVMMLIIPQSLKSSAFAIEKIPSKAGIYNWTEIKGLQKYAKLVPLENFKFVIAPTNALREMHQVKPLIKDFLKDHHFDILHGTSLSKFANYLYPVFGGIKHRILTLHDPIPHNKLSLPRQLINETTIARFRNVLLLNNSLTDAFLKRFHFRTPKLFYSRLGVYDFLKSFPCKEISNLNTDKYILFFGRIEEYKGVDNLIRAFKASEAKQLGYKLVIAGKGVIHESIEDDSIVVFNHYIQNDILSNLIRNAYFSLATYLSATQSGVIMSSFALETPVLVTPVGGLPDYITSSDGEQMGYICGNTSADSIKEAINYLLNNPIQVARFKRNIANAIAPDGDLGWRKIANDIKSIYSAI